MKVLLINTVGSSGSTGKICVDLYNSLLERNYEACIAYGRGNLPENFSQYKIENSFGTYEHVFESRIFDNHGLASRSATKRFIKFIEEYNPDVIHIHNIHGYYLNFPILFGFFKRRNYKVVWTLHDCWPFSPHGAYINYEKMNHLDVSRKDLKEYPKTILLNQSKRNYELKKKFFIGVNNLIFVTPSNWLKSYGKKSFLKEYPFIVINNGINREIFSKISSSQMNNKKIILGVANIWDERKGLNFFFDLAENIKDEYSILLIGKTGKQNKKKISHYNNITLIEQTDNQEELSKYYGQSYVFINPTTQDNYPTTNLESIACGTPVITFLTGGSGEVINKNTGVIAESKDCNGILKALKQIEIKYNNGDFKNLGEDKYLFSKEKMSDEYIQLYKRF